MRTSTDYYSGITEPIIDIKNMIRYLSELQTVQLYSDVLRLKEQALGDMKLGNHTQDISYYDTPLKSEYMTMQRHLHYIISTEAEHDYDAINAKLSEGIIRLKALEKEQKYSFKIVRSKSSAYPTVYLHQNIEQTSVYKKKLKRPISLNQMESRGIRMINLKGFQREWKRKYLTVLNLSSYPTYAGSFFSYRANVFIQLLQLEKNVWRLLRMIGEKLGISNAYDVLGRTDMKSTREGIVTYERTNITVLRELKIYRQIEVNIREQFYLIKEQHRLIFKYVLAKRFLEYKAGIKYATRLLDDETYPTWSKHSFYKRELNELKTMVDNDAVVLEDMKKTLLTFEQQFKKNNELLSDAERRNQSLLNIQVDKLAGEG